MSIYEVQLKPNPWDVKVTICANYSVAVGRPIAGVVSVEEANLLVWWLKIAAGAVMVQARPRGKEAMFTRSTRGCGHSGAPCLSFAGCLCPKLN